MVVPRGRPTAPIVICAAVVVARGGTGCGGAAATPVAQTPEARPVATVAVAVGPTAVQPVSAGPDAASAEQLTAATVAGVRPEAVPIPNSTYVRGRSTVTVNAPIDHVRETVLAFMHYAEFMPHYRISKVLGRTSTGARSVYMEVEAMNGAVQFRAQIEVPSKPTLAPDGTEAFDTKFVQGNVNAFDASWRLKRIDDGTTALTLEVYLEPKLGLPGALINHENLKGSAEGVVAMKARAEQGKK